MIFVMAGQAQQKMERLGKVTYKSTQNVYVQFESTEGISTGDTLFVKTNKKLQPVVQVNFISTRSCAGIVINGITIKVGEELIALIPSKKVEENIVLDTNRMQEILPSNDVNVVSINKQNFRAHQRENSSGRFSIQSYSNISSGTSSSDDQRWRYTLRYDVENLYESGFSFSSYLNYVYKVGEWQKVRAKPWDNLKVYDLSLGYNFDDDTNLKLGRFLNPRIANISSVDGLQVQTKFSNFYGGLAIGSRPDFKTLGFDPKLFEYGAFIGRIDSIENGYIENTIAFFQQMNNSKTDRRFAYLQHSNSILQNLNIFLSSEIDLYALERGIGKTKPSLTSFFLSSRYAPSRTISFSFSYDARKNVIYYETFRSLVDSIIENETRQGLRFGTNIRLFDKVFIGLNAGYRFLKRDIKPSKNFNGYLTYSLIPWIDISPTLSVSRLASNYVDGTIWEIKLSKFFSFIDYSVSIGYSQVDYNYLAANSKFNQKNLEADLSGKIFGPMFLSVSYEGTFEKDISYARFLLDISFRF